MKEERKNQRETDPLSQQIRGISTRIKLNKLNLYALKKEEFFLTRGEIIPGLSKEKARETKEKETKLQIGKQLKKIWEKVLGDTLESIEISNKNYQTAQEGVYEFVVNRKGITLVEKKLDKITVTKFIFNLNIIKVNGIQQDPEVIYELINRLNEIKKEWEDNKAEEYVTERNEEIQEGDE